MFSSQPDDPSGSSVLTKRTSFWMLFGIGVALTGAFLFDAYVDWIHQEDPLWSTVLENSIPTLLALTIPYAGWRLLQSAPGSFRLPEAARCTLVGSVGMIVFSSLVVGIQILQEEIKPVVIVLQMTTVGAISGLWVGSTLARVRETEREAQEDRSRLANLLDGLPLPVVHGRFEGNRLSILRANAAFEETFGQEVEEAIGKNLYEIVVPEEKREDAPEIDRQAIEQGLAEKELQCLTTEGLREFQLRVAQALDDGASETYSVYTDITERKKREKELRLFEQVVEQANDAVVVTEGQPIDEPGPRIVYANPAFLEMTGYSREEVEGKTPRILQGPETDREVLDSLRAALEHGEPWSGETINYRKNGDSFHLQWSIAPVRNEDGEIEYWMSVQRDVTQEKRRKRRLQKREKELQEAQERMELALKHTGSVIYEIDLETREVWRHGVFEDFFNAKPEELPTWDLFAEHVAHPADREKFFEFYRHLEEGRKESGTLEYRTSPETGEVRWIRDVVFVEKGEPRRLRGLAQDVTEQKRRTQELLTAKEEAEEASRLKSAMLANMSHELRTPLTSITGFSEMLKENLDGELGIFATKIHDSSKRLHRTLDSVLHLSKLEAGVQEVEQEELSLGEVVEDVVKILDKYATDKSLTVTTEIPSSPVLGYWNEDGVHRICRNLLENAIKFTPEGGRVEVRVSAEKQNAVLEVEDTGIGMDPEKAPELFEAFKQESEGLDREYEGSGLGLSIVKRLIGTLDGEIDLETEKGEGTCFTVQLPLTDEGTEEA